MTLTCIRITVVLILGAIAYFAMTFYGALNP